MKTSLPSITKIAFIPCEDLSPHIGMKHSAKIPVGVFATTTPVTFYGTPSCEAVSDYKNKGRLEKTTLKFVTTDEIPTNEPVAFVIATATGKSYLIGLQERPFPVVKISQSTGKPSGDPAANEVAVTFSAKKSLIECAV